MTDYTFGDIISNINSWFIKDGWITVYQNLDKTKICDHGGTYCGLIPNKALGNALESYNWDIGLGDSRPGFIEYHLKGKTITKYYRFSNDGIEPFIHYRCEFSNRPEYIELSEEFRLYHNLYEERSKDEKKYLYTDDNGDEIVIAIITDRIVKIKLNFLLDYINARKINFVVYFDLMRFSDKNLSELKLSEEQKVVRDKKFIYSLSIHNSSDFPSNETRTQSGLLGKAIIHFDKKYKPNIWNSMAENKDVFADFIIGFDEQGRVREYTCNKECLANYFGKNPDAPNYLTPVYFKKEVLNKYYANPEKYSVEDGLIRCGGSWVLRLDNSCDDYVAVFLGDLGGLAYKEQLYWKSYNIEKQKGLSHTAFMRAFAGEFSDPESPDLYFKMKFNSFNEKWNTVKGWYLFKPLIDDDRHYFDSFHCLTTENNRKEFDEQILGLTKIIIDSLNEKELQKDIPTEKNDKGIAKFEKFLACNGLRYPTMIAFLKNLQQLRSTTVAHRKSSSDKRLLETMKYFKIGEESLKNVLDTIIVDVVKIFNTLEKAFNLSRE